MSGLITEILDEVLASMGRNLEFNAKPWARALKEAEVGKVDGIAPVFNTPERQKILLFSSEPLYALRMVLFKNKSRETKYNGEIRSMYGSTVVTLRDALTSPELDHAMAEGKVKQIQVSTIEQQLKMVERGRADFAASPFYTGRSIAKNLMLAHLIEALTPPLNQRPVYLALSKTTAHETFLKTFDSQLRAFKKSVRYQRILNRYR